MSTSPEHYDEADPFGALERAGVTVERDGGTFTSSTIEISGISIPLGTTAGERFAFTLPDSANITVAFGKEGVLKKLSKVFTKEPQIGDQEFDDNVYITAKDETLTKRFLDNEDLKALILEFVSGGGLVIIGDTKIEVHAANKGTVSTAKDSDVARLVCHAMAFRE